jgi:hypothetical protein
MKNLGRCAQSSAVMSSVPETCASEAKVTVADAAPGATVRRDSAPSICRVPKVAL